MINAAPKRHLGAMFGGALLIVCGAMLLFEVTGILQPAVNIPAAAIAAPAKLESERSHASCLGIRMICAVY